MNQEKEKLAAQIRAGAFVANNGRVLRTINILRTRYNRLTGVQTVLEDQGVMEDEFADSINFLSMEEYIQLRRVGDRTEVRDLADDDWRMLEAKLTPKGIRLLAGGICDEMIEV